MIVQVQMRCREGSEVVQRFSRVREQMQRIRFSRFTEQIQSRYRAAERCRQGACAVGAGPEV